MSAAPVASASDVGAARAPLRAAVGLAISAAALVALAAGGRGGAGAGAVRGGAAATARRLAPETEELCLDAAEGEMCHRLVTWAMEDGSRFFPERYAGVNRSSPFHEAQAAVHAQHPDLCPKPCGNRSRDAPELPGVMAQSAHESISCDYGHGDSKPAHAGCFITVGGKLLAERITYGGSKYDIPGGNTDWREPARCTAYRETYEETGYLVAPRELLAVVRNDFHIYRCELLRAEPVKGHDDEVSWVGWLDAPEIMARLSQQAWRYDEAANYVDWLG